MKKLLLLSSVATLPSCATITNDSYMPIALSFSDGSSGTCNISNKRFTEKVEIPSTPRVRRSDDQLKYDCATSDGQKAFGGIDSTIGAKIVASAVFLDFGIVGSITDKHREYPPNFIIPIAPIKTDKN